MDMQLVTLHEFYAIHKLVGFEDRFHCALLVSESNKLTSAEKCGDTCCACHDTPPNSVPAAEIFPNHPLVPYDPSFCGPSN